MFGLIFATLVAITSVLAASATETWGGPRPPLGIEELADRFQAPKTPFTNEYGSISNIDTFKGKVVILNLWATWCAPCVKEMPSLERLSARLPNESFAVVAVSQDKGGVAIAKSFLDRIGGRGLPRYVDPSGRIARDLGARGFPTTVLISRKPWRPSARFA
jgi:thiol-disulfide isomerase/thioredoxin